jgi:hypothetical protein
MISWLIGVWGFGSTAPTPIPSPLVPLSSDIAYVNWQWDNGTWTAWDRALPFATITAAIAAVWVTGTVYIEDVNLTENVTTVFHRLILRNSNVTWTLTWTRVFLYWDWQVFNRSAGSASPLFRSGWFGNITASSFWALQIRWLRNVTGTINWWGTALSIGDIVQMSSTWDMWGNWTVKPNNVDLYNIQYIDVADALFNQDGAATSWSPLRYKISNIASVDAQNIITGTDALTDVEMDRVKVWVNVSTQGDLFTWDQLQSLRMTYCDIHADTLLDMSVPGVWGITAITSYHNTIKTTWTPITWWSDPAGQVTLKSSYTTLNQVWNATGVVNQTVTNDFIDAGI